MNTYSKYNGVPDVFLAKCEQQHEKGETIQVNTKHGKENDCIVFNLIYEKDGYFYYSIVRADGFDFREWAKRKAEKLEKASLNAAKKSSQYWNAAEEGKDFLVLAEPIKIGHHSEKRHRALIERNHKRIEKAVKLQDIAENYEDRAEYYEKLASTIKLSMPESIEYYAFELEKAQKTHAGMKNGTIERSHSFSLQYANKAVKEAQKRYDIAVKLWG